ncbi:MAG: M23 family metallopeptidase [Chloroflexia bacterium]|nr:M23 family metallopeptidase [Chloroflexia bacterium]
MRRLISLLILALLVLLPGVAATLSRCTLPLLPTPTSTPTFSPTPLPPTTTPTPSPTPTATPSPSPTPLPLLVSLQVEPQRLLPGQPLWVRLESSLPLSTNASLGSTAVRLFAQEPHTYSALLGFSVWTPAQTQTLAITVNDDLGRQRVLSASIQVLPTEYPVEYIHLLPGRGELLAPEITEAEWARVEPIFLSVTEERLWAGSFITPTHGRLSSLFGTRRSYNGGPVNSYHSGVDISNVTGTLILAPQGGRVVLAERLRVRGGTIILDHGWGVHSAYLHLSEILVQEGELVEQGQVIAHMGASGLVTGPHLHWEIRLGLIPVDPLVLVRWGDFAP